MIVVTGGAGFIGSNIVKALNQQGRTDIIVVDDLKQGEKIYNLNDCDICDYIHYQQFLTRIEMDQQLAEHIEVIFHQGACSDTTNWDGEYMMRNNYDYSKNLLHYCQSLKIPFIYASSASVYGGSQHFIEQREYEKPINTYAYSKWQFDQYVRSIKSKFVSQVVGLRYFNVYGAQEQHKGNMASVVYHFNQQILATGVCQLFAGTDGYADGEQQRDFILVDDVVKVNLWFWQNTNVSGIYNLGTGQAHSFNEVADAVIDWHKQAGNAASKRYRDFPEHLQGAYQSYTQADISQLRKAGYQADFADVKTGVKTYLDRLNEH